MDVTGALLSLEEMGLILYDEDENTFTPTEEGKKLIDGKERWFIAFEKFNPGHVFWETRSN